MFASFRATVIILALTLWVLRSYPVNAAAATPGMLRQDPPAPQHPEVFPTATPEQYPAPNAGPVVRPWQPGDPEPKGPMQIVVIEGQDGVNIIKKKTFVTPVVEVRDGKDTPLAGAAVVFTAPSDGPSVTFSNGLRSITILTDPTGRATIDGLKPISEGKFEISVAATFRSLSGSGTISLTNAMTPQNTEPGSIGASRGGVSGKTIGILVAIGGAAAVGAALALSHHGSSTSTSTTTATIGTGSGGSVGAP